MKKLFCTLLIALCTVAGVSARTFVLVTGVSNYAGEDSDLRQTTKDAKRFAELMKTQTNDVTILTSSNVTYDNVMEKLRAICERAQSDDRVIFFYSGHGAPGGLCAYDGMIPYGDLTGVLGTSAAGEKICFIDACFAGTVNNNGNWDGNVPEGQAFFVSCRPDEVSAEQSYVGAGYFTQALLKGLRGKADRDNNRQITVEELFRYLYGDVLRRSSQRQHPQLIAPKSMYDTVVAKW